MALAEDRNVRIHVHERGDRTLDGIFRLIAVAEGTEPLEEVLEAICRDVAAIVRADVVSIYVLEEGPEGQVFTMRGNVGFPAEAVGRVRLRPGEGITGFVADRLRPVSVAVADRDEHFKYIPGLGEERFPALLAVPVLRGGSAAGVLVLQRRETEAFSGEVVVVATALAPVINHALERAQGRERDREIERRKRADRRAARLSGAVLSPGTAMGRAEVLPTLAALVRSSAEADPGRGPKLLPAPPEVAIERLDTDLRKARQASSGAAARDIASLSLILEDERFRAKLAQACAAPAPVKAMSELAREYARVPFRAAPGDQATADLMGERAAEMEDLCVIVHAALSGQPLVHAGGIVVAERLRVFQALHAVARGASGFIVEGAVSPDAAGAAILRAAGVPLLASVKGVFSWIHPGDLLVVDADGAAGAGTVRVNPPATAVARFRSGRP
jgi:phosphotransferase system, enzyme I, PtsP